MKKIVSLLLILVLSAAMLVSCGPSAEEPPAAPPTEPAAEPETTEPAEALATEAPTETPTETPTEAPTEAPREKVTLLEAPRTSIVHDPAVGTVYITGDGRMYVIEGENKDGVFGGAECVPVVIGLDPSYMDNIDGNGSMTVSCVKPGTAFLLDTDVRTACMFSFAHREYKYDGQYFESLIYLKNDGTVWLRGSNPNSMFGNFEKAEEPVKLFENAVNIGQDGVSVCAITADNELYAWDVIFPTEDGSPKLIAENVDPRCAFGGTAYLTADGCFYADDSRNAAYEHRGKDLFDPSTAKVNGWDGPIGEYSLIAEDVIDIGGWAGEYYYIDAYGDLNVRYARYGVESASKLFEGVVFARIDRQGYAGSYFDEFSGVDLNDRIVFITSDGAAYSSVFVGDEPVELAESANYISMRMGHGVLIDGGKLFAGNSAETLGGEPLADNVIFAVSGIADDSIIYETSDGRLFSLGFCTPDGESSPYEIILP